MTTQTNNPFRGKCHARQKVWCGLPLWLLEAQPDEVFLCEAGWAKVDLFTFVDDQCLIEDVIGSLWGLIEGYGVSVLEDVSLESERLAEFDRVGGVEASG